jgi:phenylacetate-CoA ligase
VEEVVKKFQVLGNCQLVVEREANQDRMTFRAEFTSQGVELEGLRQQVANMIQEVLRLKGEVELLPPGTIAADAKKIEDRRSWD